MKVVMTMDIPVSLRELIGEDVGIHIFNPKSQEYIMTEYATIKPLPQKHDNKDKHEYELGWNDAIEEILDE